MPTKRSARIVLLMIASLLALMGLLAGCGSTAPTVDEQQSAGVKLGEAERQRVLGGVKNVGPDELVRAIKQQLQTLSPAARSTYMEVVRSTVITLEGEERVVPMMQKLTAATAPLLSEASSTNEATQSPIVQGKLRAEARAASTAEARERRQQERRQKEQERQAQREDLTQEAEIRRNEANERAVRETEENEPDSHHYPAAVRAGFLHGCDESTGHEESACRCAIKRIEAKVALGRYRENEHEIEEGRPLPLTYSIQYGICVGEEAVG
jgi:hypothetical protein